jgi:hypothetical protein
LADNTIVPRSRPTTESSESQPFAYRTTYLHEADLVANEFERLGIAFYRAEEGPAGVRWAMPLSAAWEPGTCFAVIVHGPHSKRARQIVSGLPVSRERSPGVWQPHMSDADKQFWRTLAWASLVAYAIGIVAQIVNILRN